MKFILVLVSTIQILSANPRIDPLVRIEQGIVRGQVASDGDYSTFFGIPYAQINQSDPFGPLLPHPTFGDTIFDAYDDSISCPQFSNYDLSKNNTQTLDCLRLNIYVPNEASAKYNLVPVLVWIHDGDFLFGSGGRDYPKTLLDYGVLIVTINYRLGPYGFMCLDLPGVIGNQGLKDQNEAFSWVRKNIEAFGGNPEKVTIGGKGTGSTSALLHLYSSQEKNFHNIIAEGGTPLKEGMFVNADVTTAIKIAEHLGYIVKRTQDALEILNITPFDVVVRAVDDLDLMFKPCKERSLSGVRNFIANDPFSFLSEKKIENTSVLIGFSDNKPVSTYMDNDNPFYDLLKQVFILNEEDAIEISEIVKHFYIGDQDVIDNPIGLENFRSDFLLKHPTEIMVSKLLADEAIVYEYIVSYENTSDADDIQTLTREQQTKENIKMNLWANFIRYGNPTHVRSELVPSTWTPATIHARPYLIIDTQIRMENRPFNQRLALWDLFFYMFGSKHHLVRQCNLH